MIRPIWLEEKAARDRALGRQETQFGPRQAGSYVLGKVRVVINTLVERLGTGMGAVPKRNANGRKCRSPPPDASPNTFRTRELGELHIPTLRTLLVNVLVKLLL
jgi:hypothetical protein